MSITHEQHANECRMLHYNVVGSVHVYLFPDQKSAEYFTARCSVYSLGQCEHAHEREVHLIPATQPRPLTNEHRSALNRFNKIAGRPIYG
jgi:hypothetical protein